MEKEKNGVKNNTWSQLIILFICIYLIIVSVFAVSSLPNKQNNIEQVSTLQQSTTMNVEFSEWKINGLNEICGFKGTVVDEKNEEIFPVRTEISVIFDYNTDIRLDNDILIRFNPNEPNVDAIGLKEGDRIIVQFSTYDNNYVVANYIEKTKI